MRNQTTPKKRIVPYLATTALVFAFAVGMAITQFPSSAFAEPGNGNNGSGNGNGNGGNGNGGVGNGNGRGNGGGPGQGGGGGGGPSSTCRGRGCWSSGFYPGNPNPGSGGIGGGDGNRWEPGGRFGPAPVTPTPGPFDPETPAPPTPEPRAPGTGPGSPNTQNPPGNTGGDIGIGDSFGDNIEFAQSVFTRPLSCMVDPKDGSKQICETASTSKYRRKLISVNFNAEAGSAKKSATP